MPTFDPTPANVVGSLLLQADDIIETLVRRHPTADLKTIEQAGRVVALVSRVVLSDSDAVRLIDKVSDDVVFGIIHDMKAGIVGRSASPMHLRSVDLQDESRGSGLGEIITPAQGRDRLAARADAMSLEAWAGPVAGPTDLAAREGIPLGSLKAWRRTRAVIELSKGRQRPVFPVQQFVQHRPVPRLADLQAIIGDPRVAWLWLVEPGCDGLLSWLDMLKEGRAEEVLEAAREDFA